MTSAELHIFSGGCDMVARCLYALPGSVLDHTMWALLLQSPRGAQVHVTEREGDSHGRVRIWSGAELGTLPGRIATIVTCGSAEPIQEAREALSAHGDFTDFGVVPCPPTARGAFGHPMRLHSQEPDVRAFVVAI